MASKIKPLRWLKNNKIRWGMLAGVWLVFVVTVVIPTWQGVVTRNTEIRDLESRLSTMDEWTVAGMWLARSVNERQQRVNTVFGRLFPDQRGRGELFLELAKVADQSGVRGFDLSEASVHGLSSNDVWRNGSSMGDGADGMEAGGSDDTGMDAPPMDGEMNSGMESSLPKVALSSYRVKAHFWGDYSRIAQFMGGLKEIERAMKVHSLVIRPDKDGIQVDLELDIYVSQASQS